MTRLLIVHLAGDFREAWARRARDGTEAYYGHAYILDQLGALAAEHEAVGYLSCLAPRYHEVLPNGAHVLGAGARPDVQRGRVIACIRDFAPTHMIVHGPMPGIIRWGIAQGIATACLFADSFGMGPVARFLRHGRLPGLLNRPEVAFVGNHGVNAARGLVNFGVRADKVIAWDFPHVRTPDATPAKVGRSAAGPFRLLYVGAIHRHKGVGDLIAAVAALGPGFALDIVGAGHRAAFERQVAKAGVGERVRFVGTVPNRDVPALMHDADAVVVPSRHVFPEGLPLTLYEALAARAPVIASDHPMFAGHLVDGESALVFPAGDVAALAGAVARLAGDPGLYARLSAGGAAAWARMQVPVKWGELIAHWARGDGDWIAARSLAATV